MSRSRRALLFAGVVVAVAALAAPAPGTERELDTDTPPSSTRAIRTPIERFFPKEVARPPVFPWFQQRLQKLPPFFADTHLEVRFRTYYLRKDRAFPVLGDDGLSEAWAMGGSISYRSGWLADLLRFELEGFTSQPIVAPDARDDTFLLAPGQDGYGVLGIANARIRYEGIALTGFRQHLDLPYVNRQDNRMTPNTFEAITLEKPEGEYRFSAGYAWTIKLRNSDEFESFTEALGLSQDRGFAHGAVVWVPREELQMGALVGIFPDVVAGLYSEISFAHDVADGVEARIDGQFTYQWEIGEDLAGDLFDDTWTLGIRGSTSYAGAVFRLGFSITGPNPNLSPFGTNPSYVDLMQRTFNAEDEKALLASVSYDFSSLGAEGLSAILNFVAGFDGERLGVRSDSREIDLTLDYKVRGGWLESFWLRVRGSWLQDDEASRDGSDVRVILRYDFPVI